MVPRNTPKHTVDALITMKSHLLDVVLLSTSDLPTFTKLCFLFVLLSLKYLEISSLAINKWPINCDFRNDLSSYI